jgi:hypothetical protein
VKGRREPTGSSDADAPDPCDVNPGGRPVGLLAKLMAAVRPQFRAEDLVFDPRDPVFGGPACAVPGCARPEREHGMCLGHRQRWLEFGKPDLAVFVATTTPDWRGQHALGSCVIAGCRYGLQSYGMCPRHAEQWDRAGRPGLPEWLTSPAPLPAPIRTPSLCRIGHCDLWAPGVSAFCHSHNSRWKVLGRPEVAGFIATYANPRPGCEHIDLGCLPAQLRLEVAYVLQCRHDEQTSRLIPTHVQAIVRALAGTGMSSLLAQAEDYWATFASSGGRHGRRAFVLDAYHRIEVLALGQGWDVEYPRQVWRLRNLGINHSTTTLDFSRIPQPWLTTLAKRWARWRLTTGLSPGTVRAGVRAVTRFAGFLARQSAAVAGLADVDRPLLERYLADLHTQVSGRQCHREHVSALGNFLRTIRQHGWDWSVPG